MVPRPRGDAEHARILDALVRDDGPGALVELAHHLAGTIRRVLADRQPDYRPVAVPHAVNLVAGDATGRPGRVATAG